MPACTYFTQAVVCLVDHLLNVEVGGFIPLKQQQLGVEWFWVSPDNSYCSLAAAAQAKQEGAGFSFVKRGAGVSGFTQMRSQWKEKCARWNSFVRQLPVLPSHPTASWDATRGFKWRNDLIPLPPSLWCLITVIPWPLFPSELLKNRKRGGM